MYKGRYLLTVLSFIIFSLASNLCLASKSKLCGSPKPILQFSDFNGDGKVDKNDVLLIKKAIKRGQYYAFYDRNADGRLDHKDKQLVKQQVGVQSTKFDQEISKLFHQVKQFQLVDTTVELNAMGQTKWADALAGHGQHWASTVGINSIVGRGTAEFYRPEGLNVPSKGNSVWGLFWGQAAIPVFENGATDYPLPGGQWMNSRVVSFANMPTKFTSSDKENWHPHAGLCFTVQTVDGVRKIILNQHTTFLQCQALPTEEKLGTSPIGPINPWVNFWMMHVWMFNLNPDGLFANTHPCLDRNAQPESEINGDREIPPFFQHHGHAG